MVVVDVVVVVVLVVVAEDLHLKDRKSRVKSVPPLPHDESLDVAFLMLIRLVCRQRRQNQLNHGKSKKKVEIKNQLKMEVFTKIALCCMLHRAYMNLVILFTLHLLRLYLYKYAYNFYYWLLETITQSCAFCTHIKYIYI